MKRFLLYLISICFLLSLCACNGSDPQKITLRDIDVIKSILVDDEILDILLVRVNNNFAKGKSASCIYFETSGGYNEVLETSTESTKIEVLVFDGIVYIDEFYIQYNQICPNINKEAKNIDISKEMPNQMKIELYRDLNVDGKWKEVDLSDIVW